MTTTYSPADVIVVADQVVPEQTWPSKRRCPRGSSYNVGDVVPVFSFCLLCFGTSWRHP